MCLNIKYFSWADYLASEDKFRYSSNKTVGENLAWGSSLLTAKKATEQWYKGIDYYDFDQPKYYYKASKYVLIKTENVKLAQKA